MEYDDLLLDIAECRHTELKKIQELTLHSMKFESLPFSHQKSEGGFHFIHSVERKRGEKDYVAPRHTRKDHQLYLCITTKIRATLRSESFTLNPGEFVIVPPGCPRGYKGIETEPEYLLIHFSHHGRSFEKLYGVKGKLRKDASAVSRRLVRELARAFPETEQMLYALATQLLIELVRGETGGRPEKISRDERIQVLDQFMRGNFSRPLGRDDFAKSVSLSPSHVGHLYQKMTGKTLIARLTEIRLDEAKKLLDRTSLPTTYIAYEVGFNSYSHFAQLFRRHEGCTPTEYRG